MTHVATDTIEKYARSRDLTVLEAFTELWCQFTANEKPTTREAKRIVDDKAYWDGKRILPHYAVEQLAAIRRRQMQDFARASPAESEPMFI